MTVGDSQRVRMVAQKIAAASTPEVRAEIEALQRSARKPGWVKEAADAMELRYDGLRAGKSVV